MQLTLRAPLAAPAAAAVRASAPRRARLSVVSQLAAGAKVRVNTSVVIYHAPKHKEGLDLQGKEGVIIKDVRQFNGEELSANLPYRTEIQLGAADDKKAKVIVHLAEHELEVIS